MKLTSALVLLGFSIASGNPINKRQRIRTTFEVDDGISDKIEGGAESGSSFMGTILGEDGPFFERLLMSSMSMSLPDVPLRQMCSPDNCASPCTDENIATGRFHHPHCDDPTKFIQCDEFGGCFVMPCAPETVWSAVDNTCVRPNTPAPTRDNPTATTTASPVDPSSTAEEITDPTCDGCASPCTAKNIDAGNFYHPHCDDPAKFLQCDEFGGCFAMPCSAGLVWSVADNTCVRPAEIASAGQIMGQPRSSEGLAGSVENDAGSLEQSVPSAATPNGAQEGEAVGGQADASSGREGIVATTAALAVITAIAAAAISSF